jgi:hypothetical protein
MGGDNGEAGAFGQPLPRAFPKGFIKGFIERFMEPFAGLIRGSLRAAGAFAAISSSAAT